MDRVVALQLMEICFATASLANIAIDIVVMWPCVPADVPSVWCCQRKAHGLPDSTFRVWLSDVSGMHGAFAFVVIDLSRFTKCGRLYVRHSYIRRGMGGEGECLHGRGEGEKGSSRLFC